MPFNCAVCNQLIELLEEGTHVPLYRQSMLHNSQWVDVKYFCSNSCSTGYYNDTIVQISRTNDIETLL